MLTVELLKRSVTEWNETRKAHPELRVYLSCADLNFADLIEADLTGANLGGANLSGANLSCADLSNADLRFANLSNANLSGAYLRTADLSGANLSGANLSGANLDEATLYSTIFANVDLSNVKGLDTVKHLGPSTIGIDTLYLSKGNIPEFFLRGCGVPDSFIEYVHSLTGKAFDYYSCFISHSTADKAFADRIHADLQAKGVRCWYAPHDMESGEHIDTQIDNAIRVHEKLLLILSENSIESNWVKREIIKAKNRESKEDKRVLFPISLIEYGNLENWDFVDSKGRDLAEEIKKYYIPSFKGWENNNAAYTKEFEKLLASFKAKNDKKTK
ncbi:MAG: toll/interleukin-1 receptor domain-containing protein [Chlorobiaceae bacterium]